MNLKRIIKEEIDDLNWIRNIQPLSYDFLSGKALYFNPHIDNDEDLTRIITILSDIGFKVLGTWVNNFFQENVDTITGLYLKPNGHTIYSSGVIEDYGEHISEYANKPIEVLDGWQVLQKELHK